MVRLAAVVVLVLRFLLNVVVAGATTAALILRPAARRPRTGLVRMTIGPLNSTGAALLGGLVTLTPGTTTLDIDLERGEMLLHLLDASSPEATVASIRRDFERPLLRLFPTRVR